MHQLHHTDNQRNHYCHNDTDNNQDHECDKYAIHNRHNDPNNDKHANTVPLWSVRCLQRHRALQ